MQRALYLYECNVPSTQHSNATLIYLLFLLCNFCTDRYIFSNMFNVETRTFSRKFTCKV